MKSITISKLILIRVLVGSSSGATLHVDAFFLGESSHRWRSCSGRTRFWFWYERIIQENHFGTFRKIQPGSFQHQIHSRVWPARLSLSLKNTSNNYIVRTNFSTVNQAPNPPCFASPFDQGFHFHCTGTIALQRCGTANQVWPGITVQWPDSDSRGKLFVDDLGI